MSARTLEKPEIDSARPTAYALPNVRTAPSRKAVPELRLEAQIQPLRRRRVKVSTFERLVGQSIAFVGMAFVAYMASGLTAQVAAESARQSGFSSSARASAANLSAHTVESRLDGLATTESVSRWAIAHGMHQQGVIDDENKLIASRD